MDRKSIQLIIMKALELARAIGIDPVELLEEILEAIKAARERADG